MSSGFHRAVIGRCARNRREQKWLLRALREHQKQKKRGDEITYRRSRQWRLVFGQYALCMGEDHPVAVILAPLGALAAYGAGLGYYVITKVLH